MSAQWQRLSPRMLLVHPIHEVARQLPLLIGAILLGSATDNPLWWLLGVALIAGFGVARWFTTSFRIDDAEIVLRTGVLRRTVLSVPRNRIRSVHTDARLLHRLLGLTVLRVDTGRQASGERTFELDAVQTGEVARLRAVLVGGPSESGADGPVVPAVLLAAWQPSWLRYSPLSLSGLVTIGAATGLVYQSGYAQRLEQSDLVRSGLDAATRLGVLVAVAVAVVAVVIVAVLLAALRSLLTFGNLVLQRHAEALYLRYGLLRIRERTFDLRRLRGGTLREPLVVRAVGGARLDAAMTGVAGAGESSLLLPPCPGAVARGVLTSLVGASDLVDGPLREHGRAARRRRWTRALVGPLLLGLLLAFAAVAAGVEVWLWVLWVVSVAAAAFLAADRVRALGHQVTGDWLVTRSGSVERRRDVVQTAGIIGWTVRQSYFQRRAGVATVIAATAAGTKAYRVLDVPVEQAWALAGAASPWIADSVWARRSS